jgi:predicted DNA binding CopG/RHH family protein
MAKYTLTQEEQEILDAYESGEIQPIPNANEEIEKHKKYAAATFKPDKKINICIASRDIEMIQKLALLEGIPYQTFISSILHKFVDGRYIEKQPNQASVGLVERQCY